MGPDVAPLGSMGPSGVFVGLSTKRFAELVNYNELPKLPPNRTTDVTFIHTTNARDKGDKGDPHAHCHH